MISLELVDADTGFVGVLGDGASIVFDRGEVVALAPAGEAATETVGEGARATLASSGTEVELGLSPLGPQLRLEAPWLPARELSACRASGLLRREGRAVTLSGIGILSRWEVEPSLGTDELHRQLAVAFADGGVLAITAARPDGSGEHGAEAIEAALVGPDGRPQPIGEALLSTEYDPQGRHRRATLELWAEEGDGPAMRAGAELICGTTLPGEAPRIDLAFLRWSLDGRPGLGSYEVVRAR